MLMEAYCWVMHCFPQGGKSISRQSKPALLIVDILHGAFQEPVDQRKDSWFISLRCGTGNVAMGARLFGFNVIAMDSEDVAIEITKDRVWQTHNESWCSAFIETLPSPAARNRIYGAIQQCAPATEQKPVLLAITAAAAPTGGGRTIPTEIDFFDGVSGGAATAAIAGAPDRILPEADEDDAAKDAAKNAEEEAEDAAK